MRFGWDLPYPSRRMPVLADEVVATSQPLAVQAGMAALARGGNAVDAALASAIALTVVEPTSNGIGSDAFAIVWDGARLHGLNASGRSPAGIDADRLIERGRVDFIGWDAVTVPGAVSSWVALSDRFGALPFADLFRPAIHYARDGFPVAPVTAQAWGAAAPAFAGREDFAGAFLPGGRAPRTGERFACPAQARTLEEIAASHGESFYRGEIAEQIAGHAAAQGAALDVTDLAGHEPSWTPPLAVDWCGLTVHELPPNGQGIAALLALRLLEHTAVTECPPDSPDRVHLQVEAVKLALADAYRHVADPEWMTVPPEDLLDPGYVAERAKLIDPERAGDPGHGSPRPGGTVYLAAGDREGRMVSLIQSNFMGFGSGVVVPGTGISLQNRGAGFVTDPGHPNVVAPRKRPFHTIIPGFVSADGAPAMAFGVMGGHMQAQGHVQMALRIGADGENPQAASDAPRWRIDGGRALALEPGLAERCGDALRSRGHDVRVEAHPVGFGGAQIVARLAGGTGFLAASDHRKDGHAAGA